MRVVVDNKNQQSNECIVCINDDTNRYYLTVGWYSLFLVFVVGFDWFFYFLCFGQMIYDMAKINNDMKIFDVTIIIDERL